MTSGTEQRAWWSYLVQVHGGVDHLALVVSREQLHAVGAPGQGCHWALVQTHHIKPPQLGREKPQCKPLPRHATHALYTC